MLNIILQLHKITGQTCSFTSTAKLVKNTGRAKQNWCKITKKVEYIKCGKKFLSSKAVQTTERVSSFLCISTGSKNKLLLFSRLWKKYKFITSKSSNTTQILNTEN